MKPIILITGNQQMKGSEFSDESLSLSHCYIKAVEAAGGIPLLLPNLQEPADIQQVLQHCQGVILSGGNDIDTRLYTKKLAPAVKKTIGPLDFDRDRMEIAVINQVLAQKKSLLAICRGHQLLNVALGGSLIADIPQQTSGAVNHLQTAKRDKTAHKITIEPDSMLARITNCASLAVNSTHHQAVARVAKALRVVAKSSDGIVEAMELQERLPQGPQFLLSVQFHPERLWKNSAAHQNIFLSFIKASQPTATRKR